MPGSPDLVLVITDCLFPTASLTRTTSYQYGPPDFSVTMATTEAADTTKDATKARRELRALEIAAVVGALRRRQVRQK